MTTIKPFERTMQYVRQNDIVRPRDIEAIGIPREYLLHLYCQRKLNRPGRRIYTLPNAAITERHSYAEVAKRVPESVLCLLSALAFHEITAQSPASVWVALGKGGRKPAIPPPSLRVVRLTEFALSATWKQTTAFSSMANRSKEQES
jgi:predicted transcriptional regulator of viral defense system